MSEDYNGKGERFIFDEHELFCVSNVDGFIYGIDRASSKPMVCDMETVQPISELEGLGEVKRLFISDECYFAENENGIYCVTKDGKDAGKLEKKEDFFYTFTKEGNFVYMPFRNIFNLLQTPAGKQCLKKTMRLKTYQAPKQKRLLLSILIL